MEYQDLFGIAVAPPVKGKPKASPLEKLEKLMDQASDLEEKIESLETGLPGLLERVRQHTAPVIAECVVIRRRVIAFLETCVQEASRKKSARRKLVDIILDLADELEERFGEDMEETRRRWEPPPSLEPMDPEDAEAGVEFFEAMTGMRLPAHVRKAMVATLLQGGRPESCAEFVAWADSPESETSGKRKGPKPRKGKDAPQLDPEAAAKDIYRGLARELHPDKTQDDEERIRRTTLMQDLTRAWSDRDLPALVRLLHAHGSEEAKAGALDDAMAEECLRQMRKTLQELESRHRSLEKAGWDIGQSPIPTSTYLAHPRKVEAVLTARMNGAMEELAEAKELERIFSNREVVLEVARQPARKGRKRG
jgi:hypothetical protein